MARVVSQALDELGNFYILKDDGILEKRDPLTALLWSKQTKQQPTLGVFVYANQVVLDIDDNVWLAYDDQLNIQVRDTATGNFLSEVLSTASNIIVAQAGGVRMFAFSTSRGVLYEVDQVTAALVRSFDLSVEIPNYVKGVFATEIACSPTGKIWIPGLIGPVGQDKQATIIRFSPAGSGTFDCYNIVGDLNVPLIAVGSDVNGKVYGATLHGSIFRFNEATLVFQYDAMYEPVSPGGVINIVTFTNSEQPVLVDDGTYAFAGGKTRTMNPSNGDLLSSISSSNVGTITGDVLGYHHVKLTRINVVPAPIVPTVDSNKLDIWVKSDGTITFTGRPGFVFNALSVECRLTTGPVLVGTAVPNADGSFSVTSAPGVGNPVGETVNVHSINGPSTVITNATSQVRQLPALFDVGFQTSGFIMAGVPARLKAKITDSVGGPVTTPSGTVFPIFRVKRDSDGHWFNGSNFVPDNGDYLKGSFDTDGQNWFTDIIIPAGISGGASLIIKDSPPYVVNLLLIPEIAKEADLQAAIAILNDLNSRVDIAFGAQAGQFIDPTTIGGFIFERLNDIQKTTHQLLRGIIGTKNVVVESIVNDVDTQAVPKGSTPSINITIYDTERRFPLDISGAEVSFKAKVNLASQVLVINEPAVIVDGPGGYARAKLTALDTAIARRLTAQIVVNIPGTGILVSPPFIFDVTDSVL